MGITTRGCCCLLSLFLSTICDSRRCLLLLLRGFHAGEDQAFLLWVELVSASLFFCQKLIDELVVCLLELLVHAAHDANVIVIDQIHFFEVECLWQLPCLICKKEVAHCLRLKW